MKLEQYVMNSENHMMKFMFHAIDCKLLAMNDESCMHLCYEKCTGYSLDISGACIARQLTAYQNKKHIR